MSTLQFRWVGRGAATHCAVTGAGDAAPAASKLTPGLVDDRVASRTASGDRARTASVVWSRRSALWKWTRMFTTPTVARHGTTWRMRPVPWEASRPW